MLTAGKTIFIVRARCDKAGSSFETQAVANARMAKADAFVTRLETRVFACHPQADAHLSAALFPK